MIGKEILNYKIESLIGKGGMGSVYLAKNLHIDQLVAIKVLNSELANNQDIKDRFKREATTLSALDHSNIVKFLNYYEDKVGVYLIMEYIQGTTLDDYIENESGPIPEKKAYEVFALILDAFRYAHEKSIVHRDIKPSNIIVTKDFRVKILDFGIARIINESTKRLTKVGARIGTAIYMSPEQTRGAEVDKRSDIYSLGVVLHQMITGQAPYNDTTMSEYDITVKIVEEELPRAKDIYPYATNKAQLLIDKATNKKPENRYQTCQEFINALGLNINEGKEPGQKKPIDPEKKKKALLVALIAVSIVIVGVLTLFVIKGKSNRANSNVSPEIVLNDTVINHTPAPTTKPNVKTTHKSSDNKPYNAENINNSKHEKQKNDKKQPAEINEAKTAYQKADNLIDKGNYTEAVIYLDKAASEGLVDAAYKLAVIYYNGLMGNIDKPLAYNYFKKSADNGHTLAQFYTGYMIEQGESGGRDIQLAIKYYEKAAINNHALALCNLGRLYEKNQNYSKAIECYSKAVLQGCAEACNNLGNIYRLGKAGEKDYKKAAKYYELAANKGLASAQNSLGMFYQKGLGVAENHSEALKWYKKAATKHFADAENNIGFMYHYGLGVTQNENEAQKWFKRAQQHGLQIAGKNIKN